MREQHSDCLSVFFCMQDGKRGNLFKTTPKHNKIKLLLNKPQSATSLRCLRLKPNHKKLDLFRSKEYKLQLMSTQEKQLKRLPENQILHCSLQRYTSVGSPYISHNSSKEVRAHSLGSNMKHKVRSNQKFRSHQKTSLTLHAKNQNPKLESILNPKNTQTLDNTSHNFPQNKIKWTKSNKAQQRNTRQGQSLVNKVKKNLSVVQRLGSGSLQSTLFQDQDQNNLSSVENQQIWYSKVKRYQFSNSIERIVEESSFEELQRSPGFSTLEVSKLQNIGQLPPQFTMNQPKSNALFTQKKNRPIKIDSLSHNARTIVSNYDTGSRISRVSESIVIEYPIMGKHNLFQEIGEHEQNLNRNFAKRLTYQPEHQQSLEMSPRWKTQKNVRFKTKQMQLSKQTGCNNREQISQALQSEGQRYARPSIQFQLFPAWLSRSTHQRQEARKTESLIYKEFTFPLEGYAYDNSESRILAQYKRSDIQANIQKINCIEVGRDYTVYLCIWKSLGLVFAMKQFSKQAVQIRKFRNKLFRQIQIWSRLNHPNVIQMYYAFEDIHNYYLVVEVGEVTLHKLKQERGVLSIAECIGYLRDIVYGLLYLHQRGIVHRNIKLDKIIITNGVCKISNFEQAIQVSVMNYSTCGVPGQILPDIINQNTLKNDCRSLGVLAYEMAFGELPPDLEAAHTALKYTPLIKRDQGFQFSSKQETNQIIYREFISKLLQDNEQHRMSIFQASEHQLFQ